MKKCNIMNCSTKSCCKLKKNKPGNTLTFKPPQTNPLTKYWKCTLLKEIKHLKTLSLPFSFNESGFFKSKNVNCLKKRIISSLQAGLTDNSRCIRVRSLASWAAERSGFVAPRENKCLSIRCYPCSECPKLSQDAAPAHLSHQVHSKQVSAYGFQPFWTWFIILAKGMNLRRSLQKPEKLFKEKAAISPLCL